MFGESFRFWMDYTHSVQRVQTYVCLSSHCYWEVNSFTLYEDERSNLSFYNCQIISFYIKQSECSLVLLVSVGGQVVQDVRTMYV